MKISMVGAGRVGSTTLFNLLLDGAAQELVLVDIAKERAEGEALDLLHGTALSHRCKIYAGDYDASADSDIVIVTAGHPASPWRDTSRPAQEERRPYGWSARAADEVQL